MVKNDKKEPAKKSTAPAENDLRFFKEVSELLREGRGKTCQAVNAVMVETYWKVGRRIVEQEQHGKERAGYGEYLLTKLSRHLSNTLGKGFSYANLYNFRLFYLTFPDEQILYTLCRGLGWSQIRLIMRLSSEPARLYYLKEARTQNWSVRVLDRNIQTRYYERLLSSQSADLPVSGKPDAAHPDDFVKDPYVLEFLGLPESMEGKESSLERAIIGHLQTFLLEMGKGFSFVGRQFRVSTETSHFYIDLV